MKRTKIVTGIVAITLLSGCARFTAKNRPGSEPTGSAQPSQPAQQSPSTPNVSGNNPPAVYNPPPVDTTPVPVSCPTKSDTSLDPRGAVQRKTIVFRGERTMIWRKNCAGEIYSKKWETRGAPETTKRVTIRPVNGSQGTQITVFNRTTCSQPDGQIERVTGSRSGNGSLSFDVSLIKNSGAVFVKAGRDNYLDYEINDCSTGRCQLVERGTLILKVRKQSKDNDCIVIRDKGCAPKSVENSWPAGMFGYN